MVTGEPPPAAAVLTAVTMHVLAIVHEVVLVVAPGNPVFNEAAIAVQRLPDNGLLTVTAPPDSAIKVVADWEAVCA